METLTGKHFIFTATEYPPAVTMKQGVYEGFCFKLINTLKEIYNFTYSVVEPADGVYGSRLSNGSWSGMMGKISKGECDMAIGVFSLTYSRYLAVDFTTAFYEESKAILIPPPTTESRLFECIRPYHWQIWSGLLLALIILPLVLCTLNRFSDHHRTMRTHQQHNYPRLIHGFAMFTLGVLVTQSGSGNRFITRHNATKALALVWCLVVVVLIHGYIGKLISFLSVPKLKPIISSLEDLPASKLTWVIDRDTSLDSLFMEAKEGTFKAIGDGLRRHPEHLTREAEIIGPQLVLNGTSAYIKDQSFLQLVMEQDFIKTGQCRLSLAKRNLFKVFKGFILPKNNPLKPLMDKKVLQMIEGGLIDYWRTKESSPAVKQCDHAIVMNSNSPPRSLNLGDVHSPFLVWGLGVMLSLIAFCFEQLLLPKR